MRAFKVAFLFLALCCCGWAATPLAVHLRSTVVSPQPVGTSIGLSPRIENSSPAMHVFRYSASVNGGPFRIIRDFSQNRDFAWTPELFEHTAAIRVTVRNNKSNETAEDTAKVDIVSRVKGSKPVVVHTTHPLVALFSAPPCPEGSQFRVAFHAEGEGSAMRTSNQPCRGSVSSNVWVAGMRANANYQMRSEVLTGGAVKAGGWMPFQTGIADADFAPATVIVPRPSGVPVSHPIVIHAATALGPEKRPFATDLMGRPIWYSRYSGGLISRMLPGGRFLMLAEGANSANKTREEQLLVEIDLAGNIMKETNASRVAEQLESRGIHSDCQTGGKECVSGFHHEAIRLPNGHTLTIAGLERMMPQGTQGSTVPVDVLGDLVIDLDEDFQVSGVWNSFDHLDITRKSYQDAKCKTGGGGCPPVLLAPEANGWTHSNSLNYIASSGDFLVSIPEQDWIVKVDWKNGKGSGKVLWRLGRNGDFKADAKDPKPWFSYAHDVGFEPAGTNILTLLDDAQVYSKEDKSTESRAQAWKLDEQTMTATLIYSARLGGFSVCCGSMQLLNNGAYSSVVGWIDFASPHGRTVETDRDGKIVYALDVEGVIEYRSFRTDDMYTAPVK